MSDNYVYSTKLEVGIIGLYNLLCPRNSKDDRFADRQSHTGWELPLCKDTYSVPPEVCYQVKFQREAGITCTPPDQILYIKMRNGPVRIGNFSNASG